MDQKRLDEIEARARAATVGPWEVGPAPMFEITMDDDRSLRREWFRHDVHFIAHARADVPDLRAWGTNLAAENARLTAIVNDYGRENSALRAVIVRTADTLEGLLRLNAPTVASAPAPRPVTSPDVCAVRHVRALGAGASDLGVACPRSPIGCGVQSGVPCEGGNEKGSAEEWEPWQSMGERLYPPDTEAAREPAYVACGEGIRERDRQFLARLDAVVAMVSEAGDTGRAFTTLDDLRADLRGAR